MRRHINDAKHNYLATATGLTGHIDDLERAWLKQEGGTGNQVNDLWRSMLAGQGFTGALPDAQYAWLGSMGYTGHINDRFWNFWLSGGSGGPDPIPPSWLALWERSWSRYMFHPQYPPLVLDDDKKQVEDEQPIAELLDFSGNGIHLTQPTVGERPHYDYARGYAAAYQVAEPRSMVFAQNQVMDTGSIVWMVDIDISVNNHRLLRNESGGVIMRVTDLDSFYVLPINEGAVIMPYPAITSGLHVFVLTVETNVVNTTYKLYVDGSTVVDTHVSAAPDSIRWRGVGNGNNLSQYHPNPGWLFHAATDDVITEGAEMQGLIDDLMEAATATYTPWQHVRNDFNWNWLFHSQDRSQVRNDLGNVAVEGDKVVDVLRAAGIEDVRQYTADQEMTFREAKGGLISGDGTHSSATRDHLDFNSNQNISNGAIVFLLEYNNAATGQKLITRGSTLKLRLNNGVPSFFRVVFDSTEQYDLNMDRPPSGVLPLIVTFETGATTTIRVYIESSADDYSFTTTGPDNIEFNVIGNTVGDATISIRDGFYFAGHTPDVLAGADIDNLIKWMKRCVDDAEVSGNTPPPGLDSDQIVELLRRLIFG